MPRGRKPKAAKEKAQAVAQEPAKVIEQVDTSNKEEFIKSLSKKGINTIYSDGVIYAVVKPDDIKPTLTLMEESRIEVNYRGSFGAGVSKKG